MSNEVLLETLRETLRDLGHKRDEIGVRRVEYQKNVEWYLQLVTRAEEQERQTQKENEEIVRKMDTLRMHIASQQNPPGVLNDKFMDLQSQQRTAMSKVRSAVDHLTNMRSALKRAEMERAGVEQELATLQSQWSQLIEQITSITNNSTK